ncbi:MAG: hypothetical protein U0W40_18465 [Acidimicrobiia bacterium]
MDPNQTPDERSLVGLLQAFANLGYGGDFHARGHGNVECGRCGRTAPAEHLRLERLERLEGASDPDEMLAVCAVACRDCGSRGTLVLTYGAEVTDEDSEVLLRLDDNRRDNTWTPLVQPAVRLETDAALFACAAARSQCSSL